MRVVDFIRRADTKGDEGYEAGKALAASAVVVLADNVAAWYDAHVPATPVERRLEIFERVIPPFEVTSVEFSKRNIEWPVSDVAAVWTSVLVLRQPNQTDDGWDLTFFVWLTDMRQTIAALPRFGFLAVDRDGRADWDSWRVANTDDSVTWDVDSEAHFLNSVFHALLTFRFCHARNVVMEERQPPRAERRRAEREGKPAPVTFKVLQIEPITKLLQRDVETHGLAKALHLCRGHFADYTKGAGLFGKYKVEVFVPEHFRGRRERGVVAKDYSVGPQPADRAELQDELAAWRKHSADLLERTDA